LHIWQSYSSAARLDLAQMPFSDFDKLGALCGVVA